MQERVFVELRTDREAHTHTLFSLSHSSLFPTPLSMPLPSCACTNKRSAFGQRKGDGECLLTRLAMGSASAEDAARPMPQWIKCRGCNLSMCVDCLDSISKIVVSYAERIELHPVWICMLVRPWHATTDKIPSGFAMRPGGGGEWVQECPLCIKQQLPRPPLPAPHRRLPCAASRHLATGENRDARALVCEDSLLCALIFGETKNSFLHAIPSVACTRFIL